jgi:hypothetical protein
MAAVEGEDMILIVHCATERQAKAQSTRRYPIILRARRDFE